MAQLGFYFDMTSCIGCKTCQIACNDRNNLKVDTLYRQVRTFEVGTFPSPGAYHLSSTCNHCENPKCVAGCPTGAMYKGDNGTVLHNKERCIGCRYCTWNCPYSVPQFIEEIGKVGKCDFCKDLIDQGQNPVCVDACVMRAIKWGDLNELKAKYGSVSTRDLPILPQSTVTNPSTLIKAKTVAKQKDFRLTEA